MNRQIFSKFRLKDKEFKNRLFLAALATQYADKNGRVTDSMIQYYIHYALTGVAFLVVEAASVSNEGRGWSRQLSANHIDALPGLTRLADEIGERGSLPILQLHHAGRQALPSDKNNIVVGPSAIRCPVLNRPVRVLSPKEISQLVEKFTFSAELAYKAGFQGIELHGAHGYLLHQFVSPITNKRDDEYGLNNPEPYKFPLEVVRSLRLNFPKMLIFYRISARDYLPKGLTIDKTLPFVQRLLENGVDLISVSGGMYQSLHGPESIVGPSTPMGVFRNDSRAIKEFTKAPIAVTGKIQFPSLADEIITNGEADLIGLGRMILRDNDWVRKASGEVLEPVRECLLCNRCNYHKRGCPDDSDKPFWLRE
ncbi:MAG: NADH:flavin oxidoreductase [Candidatus Riflebacteria bacterium]|nr:NADH:flavin oxidoreductase [Candidatus Riflebacteria bacterium]